jgi:hypothetical protein
MLLKNTRLSRHVPGFCSFPKAFGIIAIHEKSTSHSSRISRSGHLDVFDQTEKYQ